MNAAIALQISDSGFFFSKTASQSELKRSPCDSMEMVRIREKR